MSDEIYDYFYDAAKEMLLLIANSMHDRCPLVECSMSFTKDEIIVASAFLKNFIRMNYEHK